MCSHCENELGSNPGNIKEHIVSSLCRAKENEKKILLRKVAGRSNGTAGCTIETPDKRASDTVYAFADEAEPTNGVKSSRSTEGGPSVGVKAGQSGDQCGREVWKRGRGGGVSGGRGQERWKGGVARGGGHPTPSSASTASPSLEGPLILSARQAIAGPNG